MKGLTIDNVFKDLLRRVPEFGFIYDEHCSYWDDEVISCILFGDLVTFTAQMCYSAYTAHEAIGESKDVIMRVMDFLEDAIQSDDKNVRYLVADSFLENLRKPRISGGYDDCIISHLKPKTRKLLDKIDLSWTRLSQHYARRKDNPVD